VQSPSKNFIGCGGAPRAGCSGKTGQEESLRAKRPKDGRFGSSGKAALFGVAKIFSESALHFCFL
jgi:hypothetical protein